MNQDYYAPDFKAPEPNIFFFSFDANVYKFLKNWLWGMNIPYIFEVSALTIFQAGITTRTLTLMQGSGKKKEEGSSIQTRVVRRAP